MTRNADRCDRDQYWALPETKYVYIGLANYVDNGGIGIPDYYRDLEQAKEEGAEQVMISPSRIIYRIYQIREWDRRPIKCFTKRFDTKNWIELEFEDK